VVLWNLIVFCLLLLLRPSFGKTSKAMGPRHVKEHCLLAFWRKTRLTLLVCLYVSLSGSRYALDRSASTYTARTAELRAKIQFHQKLGGPGGSHPHQFVWGSQRRKPTQRRVEQLCIELCNSWVALRRWGWQCINLGKCRSRGFNRGISAGNETWYNRAIALWTIPDREQLSRIKRFSTGALDSTDQPEQAGKLELWRCSTKKLTEMEGKKARRKTKDGHDKWKPPCSKTSKQNFWTAN